LIWIKAQEASLPSFIAVEREMSCIPAGSEEVMMDPGLREEIFSILKGAGEMTIATARPDGYPQATKVNYVSDGKGVFLVRIAPEVISFLD
jgi:hypothetical protein